MSWGKEGTVVQVTGGYPQRGRWRHDVGDDPVVLWAHVIDGSEVRKVDECADGRLIWADCSHESGSTRLSEVPMPAVDEIVEDQQFVIEVVEASVFEQVWALARASS